MQTVDDHKVLAITSAQTSLLYSLHELRLNKVHGVLIKMVPSPH